MMANVEPFSLHQAQESVKDAIDRAKPQHKRWRMLEAIWRSGDIRQAEAWAERYMKAGRLGDFFPDLDQSVVNIVLPHITIMLASIVARDPQLIAVPIGGGQIAEQNAQTAERLLEFQWRRARATDKLRDATQDMLILGNGFLKVSWDFVEDERDLEDWERSEAALEAQNLERGLAILESRDPQDIEALKAQIRQTAVEVLRNEPFVEWVSPYDLFVPPNARRVIDTPWICHRVSMPKDEVLANPAYTVDEEDLISDITVDHTGTEYSAEWRRDAERHRGIYSEYDVLDTVTLYEFYDMRARKIMVFQIDADKPLFEGDLPYNHRYSPFVHMRNYSPNGHSFWAFGDLENVATLQNMFNEFWSLQIESARRAGNKYIADEDFATSELRDALESDEGDLVAVARTNGMDIGQLIQAIPRLPLSGEILQSKDELENYIQKILGINDFQAGGIGADRMSATAAAVVDGIATLRAQEKIASVEEAASHIGNLILLLCQEFMDVPTVMRVSGTRETVWQEVDSDMIWGEYLVSVEGGSTKSVNPQTREQQGITILNEIVPIIVQLGFDPIPATETALRMMGLRPEDLLVPAEQPAGGIPGVEGGGSGAEGSAAGPSNGEIMMDFGGPPMPAEMQAVGDIGL
jgi:hypothetical protein